MQFPQLNMNGTSRDTLLSQYSGAVAALSIAIDMLYTAAPHGRDYQTLPVGAYSRAAEEHVARVVAVCAVRDDLQMIAEHIASQTGGR